MGFCTIEDLESFLQIDISADKRSAAQRAIDEATAKIKNYCRQYLELVEDEVITLDSIGATTLNLPQLPVIDVSEVIEDDELLVVDDDYKLGSSGILHRIGRRWASGIQNVEITYTHGYKPEDDEISTAPVLPQDLTDVCTRAAARAYQAGLRAEELEGIPGVSATSLGDYSVSFGGEQAYAGESALGASVAPFLLQSEKRILNAYRV